MSLDLPAEMETRRFEPFTKGALFVSNGESSVGIWPVAIQRNTTGPVTRRKPGPKPSLTERIDLRVTRRQWRRLQALAYALDVPMTAVLRQVMEDLFNQVDGGTDAEEG